MIEYGGTPPENVDSFHDLIMCDELCRVGGAGILWAVFYAMTIGLPPILAAGSKYLILKYITFYIISLMHCAYI